MFTCLQYKGVSKSALTRLIPGVGGGVKGCSETMQKMLVDSYGKEVSDQFMKDKVGPWGSCEPQQLSSLIVSPPEWAKNVLNGKLVLETSKEFAISPYSPLSSKACGFV